MKGAQYDTMDEALDIGKALKKEKTFKENQEKVAQLKATLREKMEGEKESAEKHLLLKFTAQKSPLNHVCIFLFLIVLVATGLRLYVASMPVTEQWAEIVVSESVKNQVTNIIYDEYPTVSESKKEELIVVRTAQELATEQGQNAIEKLAEAYKQSYKDPEGTPYLYEVDPYYFYDIAQDETAVLSFFAHNLLGFLQRWIFSLVSFFVPDVTFVGAIFYLPIVLTILCALLVFFITAEVWNELAGFIAALFFVVQPIILEFSIPGFVDTNMLNIFFILASGFIFLKLLDFVEKKEVRYYGYAGIMFFLLCAVIVLFRYNWSAWYVSVLLISTALVTVLGLEGVKILQSWKQETNIRKSVVGITLLILIIGAGFIAITQKGAALTALYDKIPVSLKKYLHLEYTDPYGQWPDAFSLIKELKTANLSAFISYLGGSIFVVISIPFFIYLIYLGLKRAKNKIWFVLIGYAVFCVLAFHAVRVLPYFIPFFAISVGIGISVLAQYALEKTRKLVQNEKKTLQTFSLAIVVLALSLPFVYTITLQNGEKSQLMPIMDDAIYNSAIFIKERSNETAKVSTWWDRGTFYKALTDREVHMHSQPHMPTTYWLATFYNTPDEVQAKNIVKMMNCNHQEWNIFMGLNNNFTKKQSMEIMKKMLAKETKQEQEQYINATYRENNMQKIADAYTTSLTNYYGCGNSETYVVVIDDLMPRYSAVQYFAAWDFATQQPDPQYPYTDLAEGGCARSPSGAYCTIGTAQFFLNFTSMEVQSNIALPSEVYLVNNDTVQHRDFSNETTSEMSLIAYQRAGYWKMLYIPKVVAEGMYIKLMLLDGYNLTYFEKVFDEVHAETSWVKVYKVNWDAETEDEEST